MAGSINTYTHQMDDDYMIMVYSIIAHGSNKKKWKISSEGKNANNAAKASIFDDVAKQIVEKCSTGYAKVLAVKKESKSKTAPHLYDLNTLQRDCNRYLGFSAQKTLDIAQELYEKKWLCDFLCVFNILCKANYFYNCMCFLQLSVWL